MSVSEAAGATKTPILRGPCLAIRDVGGWNIPRATGVVRGPLCPTLGFQHSRSPLGVPGTGDPLPGEWQSPKYRRPLFNYQRRTIDLLCCVTQIPYNNSMSHPDPPQPSATPRRFRWRRLLQYRLRTLLIAATICAAIFGALARWCYTAEQQRVAVIAIAKSGGRVKFGDYQWPQWIADGLGIYFCADVEEVHFPDIFNRRTSPNAYKLPIITERVSDEALDRLKSLPSLKLLTIHNASSEEIARIRKALPNCEIDSSPLREEP